MPCAMKPNLAAGYDELDRLVWNLRDTQFVLFRSSTMDNSLFTKLGAG